MVQLQTGEGIYKSRKDADYSDDNSQDSNPRTLYQQFQDEVKRKLQKEKEEDD